MNAAAPSMPPAVGAPDPEQKKRLIMGASVWIGGVLISLAMIPVVNASDLASAVKTTINTILVLGVPKIFLLIAIGIMGKPGFAYLKSLIVKKLAPPATVGVVRYRIGLTIFVTMILLGSIGPYVAHELTPIRAAYPREVAMLGDFLLLFSLFLLGGDFWDKLRSLFVRDAKVVFPAKG